MRRNVHIGGELERLLISLGEALGLGAEVSGGSTGALEMFAESGRKERSEDDLRTAEDRESEPEEEHKLEDKVEGEPVDNVNQALQDSEEGEHNPVGQPLSVVGRAGTEKRIERVVPRDDESSKVGEKLAAEIEDDQKEVQSREANNGVSLGNAGLLLEIGQGGVFGELLVELSEVVLRLLLRGSHCVRFAIDRMCEYKVDI